MPADRREFIASDFVYPQCNLCSHWIEGVTCDAFPSEIPKTISLNRTDHRNPFPGDNEIQFAAIDKAARRAIDELFN